MPQTSRTANYLIVKAFHLIGEFGPDELPSSVELTEALDILNDLLDSFASLGILIPFINKLTFTMNVGQDEYILSNIVASDVNSERMVELDFANVVRDNLSYPVRVITRAQLFNNYRQVDLRSRPGGVILIRKNQSSVLQFYPVPDFAYECNIRGKFMLDHLELNDDIEELPPYHFRFLRYALARELCDFFPSSNWSDRSESTYQEMYENIKATSDIDLTIYPSDILMYPFNNYDTNYYGTSNA